MIDISGYPWVSDKLICRISFPFVFLCHHCLELSSVEGLQIQESSWWNCSFIRPYRTRSRGTFWWLSLDLTQVCKHHPRDFQSQGGCLDHKLLLWIMLRCSRHSRSLLPVVPARGGAEVALGIYYETFLIYRTCMRRAPARPVRVLCEGVAVLLSKNMTCARRRCNATPSEDFASRFTLHSSHITH